MSLSKWKELAKQKTKTGQMKQNLFDEITEEKIRSKTTDQAIAKTFRLDRLDQIAEQTKPKRRRGVQFRPEINRDGGLDYAPEVDPYEDMDVEGLLNLEDYVAPQEEKQIAKMPSKAPKYGMDPSFWQIPTEPPPLYEEKDPLAIEGSPADPEDEVEDEDEGEGEEDISEANKILDQLGLPNYNDVEKRLAEPDMTETKQRNYLRKVIKDADSTRRRAVTIKSTATKRYKAGIITEAERNSEHQKSNKLQKEIKDYMKHYESKLFTTKGSGLKQRGRGAYFFNDAKEMLQKLTLIIAEMEAGNTSVKMRNMGQTILDALLRSKHINKGQYQKLVKKYFPI